MVQMIHEQPVRWSSRPPVATPKVAADLGDAVGQVRVGCLTIFERPGGADWMKLPSAGEDTIAVLLAKDEVTFEQAGSVLKLLGGEWAICSPSRPAVLRSGSSVRIVVIPRVALGESESHILCTLRDSFSRDEPVNRVTFSLLWSLCEEASRLASGNGDDLAQAAIRILKNAVLDRIGQRRSHKDVLLRRVKEYVEWHLRDSDLSLGRVARALNCTERSVHRAFHGHGETFARYVLRLRLERCRQALSERHRSVTEIAFSYGFVNLAHFSRAYKEMFGHSPRHARVAAGSCAGVVSIGSVE
jgi:AraC-like DNA-binding protein